MSDNDKNQSGNQGGENRSNNSGSERRQSETTKREWSKIDKKGHGTGDRPKR